MNKLMDKLDTLQDNLTSIRNDIEQEFIKQAWVKAHLECHYNVAVSLTLNLRALTFVRDGEVRVIFPWNYMNGDYLGVCTVTPKEALNKIYYATDRDATIRAIKRMVKERKEIDESCIN